MPDRQRLIGFFKSTAQRGIERLKLGGSRIRSEVRFDGSQPSVQALSKIQRSRFEGARLRKANVAAEGGA
jgi:hypothetical protein